jgi:hypothetical protein
MALEEGVTNTLTINGSRDLFDRLNVSFQGITGQDADRYDIDIIFNADSVGLLSEEGLNLIGGQDSIVVTGDGGYEVEDLSLVMNTTGGSFLGLDEIAIVDSDAIIDVTGTINAQSVNIAANNTIDVDSTAFDLLGTFRFTVMAVTAETQVRVAGGHINTTGGGITLSATANITTTANANAEGASDSSTDVAIADTTIVSNVIVEVTGAGSVAATGGAVALNANHTVDAHTDADGSAGGATQGAVRGVGVLVQTTVASIEGTASASGTSFSVAAT